MKKIKILLMACLTALAVSSCKAPENIVYLQDLDPNSAVDLQPSELVTVRPLDKLMINVNSRDEKISELFNLKSSTNSGGMATAMGSTMVDLNSYFVNEQGNILFPVVGEIHVAGLTRQEVANQVRDILIEQNLIKDPYVTCAFASSAFYAVGEVSSPGRIDIVKDRINILEALAAAGDLTLTGDRTNISVYRQSNNHLLTFQLDLTQSTSILESPVFYIQPDDIIYVHPTKKQQYESTVLGTTVHTPSFWLGITSSVISLGIAIVAFLK